MQTGRAVGYARVSTRDQNPFLQIDALMAAGVAMLYSEKKSGAARKRPEFDNMMREIRDGDIVVVWKLDRLGRTLRGIFDTIDQIHAKGAKLRVLTQQIDTSTSAGKFMLAVFAAIAELERDLTIDRTKAGLKSARARGRVGGRRVQYKDEDVQNAAEMFRAGLTLAEAAQKVRNRAGRAITPVQLHRRIRELEERVNGAG